MPAKVHDAGIRDAIVRRVKALGPKARSRWGKMTVDQMLWHVNQADAERARCLRLIDAVANRTIDGVWVDHPTFGPMIGEEVSRLHAKHLDHHLRQFGA